MYQRHDIVIQVLEYAKSLKGCENLVDHLSLEGEGDKGSTTGNDRRVTFDEHMSLYDIKMGIKSSRYV